jgi:transcriptional regulator with XRE-family HTH domain
MAKKRIKLSDQLRRAVENCGQTRYRIAKETGISEGTLSRFMSGDRGLPMKTLDQLADYLELDISVPNRVIAKIIVPKVEPPKKVVISVTSPPPRLPLPKSICVPVDTSPKKRK